MLFALSRKIYALIDDNTKTDSVVLYKRVFKKSSKALVIILSFFLFLSFLLLLFKNTNKTVTKVTELQKQNNYLNERSGVDSDFLKAKGGYKEPPNKEIVPKPNQEDKIHNFFNLISEKRITEAVESLSSRNINSDTDKQSWAVHFNAFESVKIQKIEKTDENIYKVTFEAVMSAESADEVIPYFGYENGTNIRWIKLVKENDVWKIDGIYTAP